MDEGQVAPMAPKHPEDVRDLCKLAVGQLLGFDDDDSSPVAVATLTGITIYETRDDFGVGCGAEKHEWSWVVFLANQAQGGKWMFWGAYLLSLKWHSPHGWLGPVDALARLDRAP